MAEQTGGVDVEVRAATKRFKTKTALEDLDLDVGAGSFCVLLGPSGSGKTTLLRCVAGIERLTSGSIAIGGRLVADGGIHSHPERRNLSMVFQDYALWPHLSALRNVEFALGRRQLGRQGRTTRAREMLERVGLAHHADRYPNELSGGEQQRVALARALVASTGLLLFDEPLSNLDADLRERLRLEIATLTRASEATSVYITHDQAEAFALADRIGVLHDGRLVQFASPETIYHHPATPFVARFTGLAGEVAAVVAGAAPAGGGAVAVRLAAAGPDCVPVVVDRAPGAGDPPAGAASLLVRPAAVTLVPPGTPGRHFEAVVVDAAYRGRGYDHAVRLADGTQLVGIHDPRRWARGDRVAGLLGRAGCFLFAATPAPATPDAPDAAAAHDRTRVGPPPPPTPDGVVTRVS